MNSSNALPIDSNEAEIFSAINELASNTADMIRARRKNERIRIDANATLVPANLSQRLSAVWTGICHDISSTGCRLVINKPILVGDVFLMTLDNSAMDIDPIYVRAIRCHLLREDSFECGVAFFSEIHLGTQTNNPLDDLSL